MTTTSVSVEFNVATQGRAALDAAAYRLIGSGTCQIEQSGERWVCQLIGATRSHRTNSLSADELRSHFIDLVTDENMRERLAAKTDRVRDVILALAFGALANDPSHKS